MIARVPPHIQRLFVDACADFLCVVTYIADGASGPPPLEAAKVVNDIGDDPVKALAAATFIAEAVLAKVRSA